MGKRTRKRVSRPLGTSSPPAHAATVDESPPPKRPRTQTGRRIEGRPKPPWHPIPVSEVALAAGLLVAGIGCLRGPDSGAIMIGAGILLATFGVVELCVREHFAGFRSHTLLLAFLPVVFAHTILRLFVTDRYEGPVAILTDMGLFAALNLALLDRFRRASRRRSGPVTTAKGGLSGGRR